MALFFSFVIDSDLFKRGLCSCSRKLTNTDGLFLERFWKDDSIISHL